MPISTSITKEAIKARFEERIELMHEHILQALNNAGLEGVNTARTTHRYIDRTGNLTSSINYAIVEDGKVLAKGNPEVVKNGQDGKEEALEVIEEYASNLQGLHLILVAGKDYAMYVEAMGLNVLDGGSIKAKNEAIAKIQDVLKIWSE